MKAIIIDANTDNEEFIKELNEELESLGEFEPQVQFKMCELHGEIVYSALITY